MSPCNNLAVLHHNGTNRHFVCIIGFLCFFECLLHIVFIALNFHGAKIKQMLGHKKAIPEDGPCWYWLLFECLELLNADIAEIHVIAMILQSNMAFENFAKIWLGFELAASNQVLPVVIAVGGRNHYYAI